MSEQCCETCHWAKPSDMPGWKLCTFPLPAKPTNLPYWAINHDSWDFEKADVEVSDGADCAVYEPTPATAEEGKHE